MGHGWGDTGQHFTNTRGGVLLEGRHGSLDALITGDNRSRSVVEGELDALTVVTIDVV